MNLEELKLAKKSKTSDIQELNNLIQIAENEKYSNFIGKYFVLSATCIFRVDKIEYVNGSSIECEGLRIVGNKKYSNNLDINILGSGSLRISESNKEITKEKFVEIMTEWIEEFSPCNII